jgi:hypothetical protein
MERIWRVEATHKDCASSRNTIYICSSHTNHHPLETSCCEREYQAHVYCGVLKTRSTSGTGHYSTVVLLVGYETSRPGSCTEGKGRQEEGSRNLREADPGEASKTSAAVPPPVAILESPQNASNDTILQSPTSSAWRSAPSKSIHTPKGSLSKLESMQSPTSTAWKPSDIDAPVLMHRGSSISMASDEEIKQVEEDEKIVEEDEDAVED